MPAGIAPRARRSPIFMYAQLVRTRKYTPQCGASWYYTARTPACQTPRTRVCLSPRVNGAQGGTSCRQVAVSWQNTTWRSFLSGSFGAIAAALPPGLGVVSFSSPQFCRTLLHIESRDVDTPSQPRPLLRDTSPFVLKRGYISPASRVSLGPFEKKQSAHHREKITAFFALKRIYRLGTP